MKAQIIVLSSSLLVGCASSTPPPEPPSVAIEGAQGEVGRAEPPPSGPTSPASSPPAAPPSAGPTPIEAPVMSMPIPRSGLPKPSSASSAQDKRTAITAYKEAMRHFSAGDYRAALPLFQKADAHVPGAMPKFRAALCYDQLGRGQEAIAAYEAFLDSGPDPQKYQSGIEQAVKRIQALRRATP